jgi:hypothetical protein
MSHSFKSVPVYIYKCTGAICMYVCMYVYIYIYIYIHCCSLELSDGFADTQLCTCILGLFYKARSRHTH